MSGEFKLNLHLIGVPTWARELAGEWVKCLNPPTDAVNLFTRSRIIARYYGPGDWNARERQYIAEGDWKGYFDACEQFYSSHPGVYAFEGPNEPPVQTREQRQQLNRFIAEWAYLMHKRGLYAVGGNLSVGWPDGKADILDLTDAVKACDYWGLHEYWRWPMKTWMPYRPTRYRAWVLAPLAAKGSYPNILITECGITCAIVPGWPDEGWQTDGIKQGQYWDSLVEYNTELCQDEQVKAAFVFTGGEGAAFQDWDTFEVNRDLARMMKRAQEANPSQPQLATEAQLRAAAWTARGIAHNPDAAFPTYARAHNLGVPMTAEIDVQGVRLQGYAGGIVYAPIGAWDKCEVMQW